MPRKRKMTKRNVIERMKQMIYFTEFILYVGLKKKNEKRQETVHQRSVK